MVALIVRLFVCIDSFPSYTAITDSLYTGENVNLVPYIKERPCALEYSSWSKPCDNDPPFPGGHKQYMQVHVMIYTAQ